MQHINQPPVELQDLVPNVDKQIADTIMKGLAISVEDRWQSIDKMVKQFRDAEIRLVQNTRKYLKDHPKEANAVTDKKTTTGKPAVDETMFNDDMFEEAFLSDTDIKQESAKHKATKKEAHKKKRKAPEKPTPSDDSDDEIPALSDDD